jgi:aspartate/methionine/tyrosine aminotransferase
MNYLRFTFYPSPFTLNDHPLSILEIDGAKDICIEINSLSKSQNMPGWRIAIMQAMDCRFDPRQSGMFLWGKIPATYENSEDLADAILQKANVFITPGFIFGSNGDRYIRISLCCNEEKLQEALERIKQL